MTKNLFSGRAKLNRTIIEDDVWIGANTIILQGVVISFGSIVGAGSVVTKDIPPFSIFAGNPARKIKERFNDELQRSSHAELLKKCDFKVQYANRR